MPSPFPGMDPYIEAPKVWSDFHADLAGEMRADLNARIQPKYVARLTPHTTYEIIEVAATRGIRPDVGVYEPQPSQRMTREATSVFSPAPPTPVESRVQIELPLRLYTVEIHESDSLELVTAIEILSPANKQRGHDACVTYRRKRRELLRSSAHMIEIDLLRGGERPPLETPVPPAPYYITLSRWEDRPKVKVWPIQLRDKLPAIPVPLREPDADVMLELAAVVASVYERGGYATIIDYRQPPPPPPLIEEETAWLNEYLQKQGAR